MAQTPEGELSSASTLPKRGTPVIVWVLGGCGCLFFGSIILGILMAIALPSFLSQIEKARDAQAKSMIGAINRAQQAHFLEHGTFANALANLDTALVPETDEFYRYQILPQVNPSKGAVVTVESQQPELNSYTGFVFVIDPTTTAMVTGICATDRPSPIPPTVPLAPTQNDTPVECPAGSSLLP